MTTPSTSMGDLVPKEAPDLQVVIEILSVDVTEEVLLVRYKNVVVIWPAKTSSSLVIIKECLPEVNNISFLFV